MNIFNHTARDLNIRMVLILNKNKRKISKMMQIWSLVYIQKYLWCKFYPSKHLNNKKIITIKIFKKFIRLKSLFVKWIPLNWNSLLSKANKITSYHYNLTGYNDWKFWREINFTYLASKVKLPQNWWNMLNPLYKFIIVYHQ